MSVKIIENELVDWEPLRMRFVPNGAFTDPNAVTAYLETWFADNARTTQTDCDIRHFKVSESSDGSIEAFCEHLTKKALRRLVKSMGRHFHQLRHVEIGEAIDGVREGQTFDWVTLPQTRVTPDPESHTVDAFAISFTPVTVGHFTQFMEEAGYVPIPDRVMYAGYLIDDFRLNFGRSRALPLFGVAYDDAIAYCEWAGLRLPTEPELHHFFVCMVRQGREFKWHGECWTTTSAGPDVYVVCNGPYRVESLEDPIDRFRKRLHRRHYQPLESPCFRVASSLGSR